MKNKKKAGKAPREQKSPGTLILAPSGNSFSYFLLRRLEMRLMGLLDYETVL